jgi:transposase-like protein
LAKVRWPEGVRCPHCKAGRSWRLGDRRWRCAECRRKFSLTAGTLFERTHLPVSVWFQGAWHLTSQKQGVSALGLQHALGLGSYETAWTMLHKLRRAMVRPGRDRLSGIIEVDETLVGGVDPGAGGRGEDKCVVVIACEVRGQGTGRIRLARIPDASADSLTPFCEDVIEAGSTIRTDGWLGYNRLARHGFIHERTSIRASGDPAHVSLPRVHRAASLLKRWMLGTHQGAARAHQLDHYLNEFTFRFNRRQSKHRGLLFYRLIELAVETQPHPFNTIRYGDGTSHTPRARGDSEPSEPTPLTTLDDGGWFDTPEPDDYPF